MAHAGPQCHVGGGEIYIYIYIYIYKYIPSLSTIINASDATFHVNLLRNMRIVGFVST